MWLVNCLCELPEALLQKALLSERLFPSFWKWWTTSVADVESSLVHLQSVFKAELYLRFITVVANEVTNLFGGDSRGGLQKLSLLPIIASFFSYSRWEGRRLLKYTQWEQQRKKHYKAVNHVSIFLLIDIKHLWDTLTYHETEDLLFSVARNPSFMNKYIYMLCQWVYVNICSPAYIEICYVTYVTYVNLCSPAYIEICLHINMTHGNFM